MSENDHSESSQLDTTALSCRAVSKTWAEGTSRAVVALESIDLDVARNEFIVLLGPSGCGKSTLLYLVAGLEALSAGELDCHGIPVDGPDSDRSLIFQQASLYPWLSVAENVAFGLKLRGVSRRERREKALHYLRQVGLAEVLDKRPHELSGGMRQRASVARALAMEPRILLMDEPFAALDVQTRNKLQSFLIEVWQNSGASILFVTHHIDEALALADRVVVFTARPGRIKAVLPIDMPRPRDLRDPQLHALRDELTGLLADEVDRAFAEQERQFSAV
ncbi:MAG: ABC transporter ATP-binding protein [Gammaproteobacteria bacterium]|nr:ABC transporter ATP-binding protein [Gammaproteobacteria bacterium]